MLLFWKRSFTLKDSHFQYLCVLQYNAIFVVHAAKM